jgi:hypothetical protein
MHISIKNAIDRRCINVDKGRFLTHKKDYLPHKELDWQFKEQHCPSVGKFLLLGDFG